MTFARDLRNNATPEERALWKVISSLRPRFTRQLQIGPFVADFAYRRARLIVELDGSQHADSVADRNRTAMLESEGWRVLRFWNREIWGNLDGVVMAVAETVANRLPASEAMAFTASRDGRERKPRPRISENEPSPAPPRSRGGEAAGG